MFQALLNLLKGAPKAIANKSFVNLADDGMRMAGNVKFPSAISSKLNSPLKPLHLGGLGSTAVSTPRINQIPNVVIPKPSVASYAPVGVRKAQDAQSALYSKWGMQSAPVPSMNISSMGGSPIAAAATNKGFPRKAGEWIGKNVLLPGAIVGGVTDVAGTLLGGEGAANDIAFTGPRGGNYDIGLSPTRHILNKVQGESSKFSQESLAKRRLDLLEEQYGGQASAYNVALNPALSDEENKFLIAKAKQGEERDYVAKVKDDDQRRKDAMQMEAFRTQLAVNQMESNIAMEGLDIQERLLGRNIREDTFKSVLALIALMKQS